MNPYETKSFELTPEQLWLLINAHHKRAAKAATYADACVHLDQARALLGSAHDLKWERPK